MKNHSMRMPVCTLVIIFIFQCSISFAQINKPALLYFKSHAFALGVNKSYKPIIGTRVGEVAFIDPKSALWSKTNIDTGHIMDNLWIDQICYFNTDTAIVSGSIKDKDKHSFICRTTDGGKNWQPVDLAANTSFADAAYLDDGQAWLGSGTEIAYTKDYGLTWSSFPVPNKKETFNSIYFNNKQEGIIGARWNVLAYTPDNCKTWITLPTPLNQLKYRRLSLDAAEFNRVAIFKNYLLVVQENLVFYSKRNKVNWIPLPGYTDFYTDAENSALFFEQKKGKFIKVNKHLKPICSFESIGNYEAAICRNGSLFILNEDKITQINDNKFIVTPLYAKVAEEVPPTPHYIGSINCRAYGYVGNKIYIEACGQNKYSYAFTLPFATDSGYLSMKDAGTVLFNRNDDSVFYYTIANGNVERNTNKNMLENFCSKGIKTIIFSSGVDRGHHHVYSSDTVVYELQNDRFVLVRKVHKGQAFVNLKDNPGEIDKNVVDEFVKTIPAIYKKQATINDLGFTSEEYDTCRKNILAFKTYLDDKPVLPGWYEYRGEEEGKFQWFLNNLDFDKLIRLVDSVKTIKPDFIRDYFYSGIPSNSNNGLQVVLVNDNNEELRLRPAHSRDYAPVYFPWFISVNGSHMQNRAIELNRFMEAVYPGFLPRASKMFMLQCFVKQLYSLKYL